MVLVVYLFLGNLRATLIPTIAVPVNLIGTFVVLDAIGYSANTVSLLAIVLASASSSTMPSSWSRRSNRAMAEHPSYPRRKRPRPWVRSPRRSSPSRWSCSRCSCRWPSSRNSSGELFRQFAVTVAVAMFLSAMNALTLSPGIVRRVAPPAARATPGPDRCVMRAIEWVRDAYGDMVARLARLAIMGLVMVGVAMAGVVGPGKGHADGLPAGGRPGAFFVDRAVAGRSSVGRPRRRPQIEDDPEARAGVADYSSTIGLNFIDNYSQPNAAFVIVSLKPFEERGRRARRSALIARLRTQVPAVRGGTAVPLAPPPIIGLGTGGRLHLRAEDLRGGDPQALAQVLRGLLVAANQDPRSAACSAHSRPAIRRSTSISTATRRKSWE